MIFQALEHYTDLYDIKRAVVHTHLLNPEVSLCTPCRSWVCMRGSIISGGQGVRTRPEKLQKCRVS